MIFIRFFVIINCGICLYFIFLSSLPLCFVHWLPAGAALVPRQFNLCYRNGQWHHRRSFSGKSIIFFSSIFKSYGFFTKMVLLSQYVLKKWDYGLKGLSQTDYRNTWVFISYLPEKNHLKQWCAKRIE